MLTFRLLTVVIICTFASGVLAQAPGYLGKRMIIGFSTSLNVAINGPTAKNRGLESYKDQNEGLGINYEFEGNIEYVLKRYRSLGITFSQYNSGLNFTTRTESLNSFGADNDFHDMFIGLNVKSIGFNLHKYNRQKGGLAPLGNYFYWGLKSSFVNPTIKQKETNFGNDFGELTGNHAEIIFNDGKALWLNYYLLGWNNQSIFWDRLVLKTGVRFGVPLTHFFNRLKMEADIEVDEYKFLVGKRLALHELYRIDFGVGFLIF